MGGRNIIRLITAPRFQSWREATGLDLSTSLSLSLFTFTFAILELERSIRVGPVDFAASLGGLFGLCLGFSIISFIEILYWVLAAVFRALLRKGLKGPFCGFYHKRKSHFS